LAKKLEPKMRVFAPVIVRGEEDKGVRLWEFGKEVYQSLLSLAADEEVGDFTDILEGRDMKIETVGPDSTGTTYNKSKVLPALKTSTLSDDNNEVEKWLSTQPEPISFYKKYEFDEIKGFLAEWLNPEAEAEEETQKPEQPTRSEGGLMDGPAMDFEPTGNVNLEESRKPIANKAFATPKKEIFAAEEFDDLFNED
jgi:hypothetical protein